MAAMKKTASQRPNKKEQAGVVRLEDLAPRKDVTGRGRTVVFGERVAEAEAEGAAPARKRRKKT
jgi:hypothetical protein